jgi:phosphoadenosine phosphosulfate reductase
MTAPSWGDRSPERWPGGTIPRTTPQSAEVLATQAAKALEGASAEEIMQWAADTFDDRMCVASSMTDAVLIHVASLVQPGIDVLFLDTGYHFAETIGTRDAVAVTYPVNVVSVTPELPVAGQDAKFGPRLYERDPDFCCQMRKVAPLNRALRRYDAWVTGVRRAETLARRQAQPVEWDARHQMVKVNPLIAWTDDDVDKYIAERGILVNPLVYDGYPSIGCATCTLRVEPGADPRSGRWSGTGKSECGIHE